MLDQNTDRMWYVIGAVVIGGLIITAAIALFNGTGMEMIKDSMGGLTDMAKTATEDLSKEGMPTPDGTINLLSQLTQMPLF